MSLLERSWTPGEVIQAEDRCHRIGMKGSLHSHWFKLGFVDELIDNLLLEKSENIKMVIGSRKTVIKRQSLTKMFTRCLQE